MKGDNDRHRTEYGGEMVPAMLHAFMIARNTAMMCQGRSTGVQDEFQRMFDELAARIGIPRMSSFVNEYRWFEACEALKGASAYHWHTETGRWGGEGGNLTLIVDGRQYRLNHTVDAADPRVPALQELIERFVNVEAVKGPPVSDWRPYTPPAEPDPDEEPAGPRP